MRESQKSLLTFIDQASYEPEPAEHHKLIIDKLEALERGEIDNLMIFMPPGSAKSTYASVLFPAWFMGKQEGRKVIAASYGQELADRFGRKVRGIVRDEAFSGIFNVELSGDSQAASRFGLTNQSEYYGVGVGGAVTGFRADIGVIDDPVKSREDAESHTIRTKTIEWYKSDFWTRLKPGAKQLLIMTRWHEEDLAGYLLEEAKQGGMQWEVLELPMEAYENDPLGREVGERLWKEWFTDAMVEQAKRDTRAWTSLYQQRPTPEEGDYFKREWFRYYTELPANCRVYGASDYAVTDKGGDWTVHGVAAIDSDGNLYVIDWWREQTDTLTWVELLLDLAARHKPLAWGEENGQILKSLDPLINKRMQERGVYFTREQYASASDKRTRAQAIRGRMQQGKVYFPRTPWVSTLEAELLTFPNAKHDDQVDVLSLLGRMLDKMHGGKKYTYEELYA